MHRQAELPATSAKLMLLLLLLASSATVSVAQMTEAEKKEALDFHNYLRRNVVPRAADMNALFWSDSLADLAQQAADTCKFEHNYGGVYANLGENLYMGGRRNFSEILMMMFLEREVYNYTSNACVTGASSKYPMFSDCGHYYQLAAANLFYVGCGITNCNGNYLAACEYDRFYSQPPYQAGEPGTKCSHSSATWHQNDLCYRMSPLYPQPQGPVECKIECMNGGTMMSSLCICQCPAGYDGARCQDVYLTGTTTSCEAQVVTCENGGTPTMSGTKCSCVCPTGYRGERCQVNSKQADNSVFWYFGQAMRYASYYPVNATVWNVSLPIEGSVRFYLTNALNELCKTNFQLCCPEATTSTTSQNFVNYEGFAVTDFYPTGALDGSLKVGTHFRMLDNLTGMCNVGISPLVNGNAMLQAAANAFDQVSSFTALVGVTTVKYDTVTD